MKDEQITRIVIVGLWVHLMAVVTTGIIIAVALRGCVNG